MAKFTNADTGKSVEVPEGEPFTDAAETVGVPFSCRHGVCGTCMIEVVEGMKNLAPRSQPEEAMGLEGNTRLTCQCRIKNGEVKFKV